MSYADLVKVQAFRQSFLLIRAAQAGFVIKSDQRL